MIGSSGSRAGSLVSVSQFAGLAACCADAFFGTLACSAPAAATPPSADFPARLRKLRRVMLFIRFLESGLYAPAALAMLMERTPRSKSTPRNHENTKPL